MFEELVDAGFDVAIRNHSEAILKIDFETETRSVIDALLSFKIDIGELVSGGGGESGQTQRLRKALSKCGWIKHNFRVQTIVDGVEREAQTHEVDHVFKSQNGVLALEIEWNNKDPFFDRDLENFQRLHAQSAISVGLIVTRGATMQEALFPRIHRWLIAQGLTSDSDFVRLGVSARTASQKKAVAKMVDQGVDFTEAFAKKFVSDKFGKATTHWSKLDARVQRGVGNPCPLVLIGLPASILVD